MHASDLRGRAVVTLADAAKVGTVDDVLFDAQYRRVLGFRVKKSLMGKEAVPRTKVQSVGADALIISVPEAVNAEKRFTELASATSLKDFTGTKVISEGGDYVGTIRDVELDSMAEFVVAYLLSAPLLDRMRHREPQIRADAVLCVGAGGIMTVPNEVAMNLQSRT